MNVGPAGETGTLAGGGGGSLAACAERKASRPVLPFCLPDQAVGRAGASMENIAKINLGAVRSFLGTEQGTPGRWDLWA